jgi:prepilin-type N-terminal cleavage/methylation domain-containing protein
MRSIPANRRGPGNRQSKMRHGFNLIELIVVVGIIAVVAALFMPSVRSGRGAARRAQCRNNIKNIVLALHNYKDDYGVFPPAYTVAANGKPLHSWRTLILPYLEQKELYKQIDLSKPWNDPVNARLNNTRLAIYTCFGSEISESRTTYLALVTPDSCLLPGKSRDASELTDCGKTAIVVEVDAKHAVPWMSPEDADESIWLNLGPKSELPHEGGSYVALVDGSTLFVSTDLSAAERRAMISVARKKNDPTPVGALVKPNSPSAQ